MSLSQLLRNFDVPDMTPSATSAPPEPATPTPLRADDPEAREDLRKRAYEEGYQAGWDDCMANDKARSERVSAALERSLQDLSFTYHEARQSLSGEIEGFLRTMLGVVLGDRMPDHLLAAALDLAPLAEETTEDAPLTLTVSPDEHDIVAHLIAERTGGPDISLKTESALAPGQAFVSCGDAERKIDLAGLRTQLLELLDNANTPGGEASQRIPA